MDISVLYKELEDKLSPKRYLHTLGVEKMAALLGEIYLPTRITELRCAALLHDIAKELGTDEQLELMRKSGFSFTDEDLNTPSAFHSFAAPELILRDFSDYATPDILSAVFYHTLGDLNMSLFDKIIFISDYIEEGRAYRSCIEARELLFDLIDKGEDVSIALNRAIVLSLENTRNSLNARGVEINSRSIKLLNSLLP